MILIQNAIVYSPQYLGKKDLLLAGRKICRIDDYLDIPENWNITRIDGSNLILTPGFIDSHVHILGGGGEGGFRYRTPEVKLTGLTKCGITSVVGCLGTDGFGRDIAALVAKIKSLREQGISAYGYTGSYQIPVHTLTGNITKDIMMVDEIIGTGEIAISDNRSSQPTYEEFLRVCAETRLGGVLSGKAGIVNVHLGGSPQKMDLIFRVVNDTEIPISQIYPTHINRNPDLFNSGLAFAKMGGTIDFTGNDNSGSRESSHGEIPVSVGIKQILDLGISSDLFTISSDGQGSYPKFDSAGKVLGVGLCQSSALLKEVKECVLKEHIPLEVAIKAITSNPARVLALSSKGYVKEGYDADLCLLTAELNIHTVIANGQIMVENGDPCVNDMF